MCNLNNSHFCSKAWHENETPQLSIAMDSFQKSVMMHFIFFIYLMKKSTFIFASNYKKIVNANVRVF